jgi:hypothetical protein
MQRHGARTRPPAPTPAKPAATQASDTSHSKNQTDATASEMSTAIRADNKEKPD